MEGEATTHIDGSSSSGGTSPSLAGTGGQAASGAADLALCPIASFSFFAAFYMALFPVASFSFFATFYTANMVLCSVCCFNRGSISVANDAPMNPTYILCDSYLQWSIL